MDKPPFNNPQKKIEKPPINYIDVVIDDEYIKQNLLPNGALRMKGGHANWNGQVDIMRYSIADTLAPEYRDFALDKIEKRHAAQEKTYEHEWHHIRNREHKLAPHEAAKNLREFLAFRVLDELSAFTTGEIYNQEVTADTILSALKIAEKNVVDSYLGQPFMVEGQWFAGQHANNPAIFSRQITTDTYHRIMRQYFTFGGSDGLAILQQAGKIPEFTTIINGLIMKLDPILENLKPKE